MHLDLLPAAQRLRDAGLDRVDRAYAGVRITETLGIVQTALLASRCWCS
jgi:hypothetical protein